MPGSLRADAGACPSCGRTNGGAKICPACGARTTGRLALGPLRYTAAGLLVVAGVYFLLAIGGTTPRVAIAELSLEKHNARRVSVRGTVTRVRQTPDPYGKGGSLVVTLEDPETPGTPAQNLVVRASGATVLRLVSEKKIPAAGDLVDVAGVAQLTKDSRTLNLNSADALTWVTRRSAPAELLTATVEAILAAPKDYEGKTVRVAEAEVVEASGPVVKVADPGKDRGIVVFGAPTEDVGRGQRVMVTGVVEFYSKRKTWEIKIARGDADGWTELGGSAAPEELDATVATLLARPKDFEGKVVRVREAHVEAVNEPLTLRVADAPGANPIVVFGVEAGGFRVGQVTSVRGTLEFYTKAGFWQLHVRKGDREGASPPRDGGGGGGTGEEPVTIGKLLAGPKELAGKRVQVKKAVVTRVNEKWTIEVADPDTKDSIVVFGLSEPGRFKEGQFVTVRGVVEYYEKGKFWEIKLAKGDKEGVVPYQE
ncbi:MAG: zinc ribbon domain-containing protein [Planctomycetes bacterium]|nr:zinc ribbon domain-containing protein [Planctomycetota bacterium]